MILGAQFTLNILYYTLHHTSWSGNYPHDITFNLILSLKTTTKINLKNVLLLLTSEQKRTNEDHCESYVSRYVPIIMYFNIKITVNVYNIFI